MVETLQHWERIGVAHERLGHWTLTERGRSMFGAYITAIYPTESEAAA